MSAVILIIVTHSGQVQPHIHIHTEDLVQVQSDARIQARIIITINCFTFKTELTIIG